MCGIIGIISDKAVTSEIIQSLKLLEYRGYDSAGVGFLDQDKIQVTKVVGKINELDGIIKKNSRAEFAKLGIGHTRWATHGQPHINNAHPLYNEKVAIVHNGIIENFMEIKSKLEPKYKSQGDTDTEVILNLITKNLDEGCDYKTAIFKTINEIKGAFAFSVILKDYPNLLIGVRKSSPMVAGITKNGLYIGSDALSIIPFTNEIIFLEDGDVFFAKRQSEGQYSFEIFDNDKKTVFRQSQKIDLSAVDMHKGKYEHYMLKEIFEQPKTITNNLLLTQQQSNNQSNFNNFQKISEIIKNSQNINIIACGSSYYAGIIGKYLIEKYLRIKVNVEIASEFRYREPVISTKDCNIFISQSGETIDTLCALEMVKKFGAQTICITNAKESSIYRSANEKILMECGPEIGVASTKAFTAQLSILIGLVVRIADGELKNSISDLPSMKYKISQMLTNLNDTITKTSQDLSKCKNVIYIGRGLSYPIAMEGSLKLKEISYIQSDGLPAGELKHGPIALIDENTTVIAIAPFDMWFEKTLSNVQEIISRKGKIIFISTHTGITILKKQLPENVLTNVNFINVYDCEDLWVPIFYTIPIQLLAYHVAVAKGNNVDQPRNLAKSVTVE